LSKQTSKVAPDAGEQPLAETEMNSKMKNQQEGALDDIVEEKDDNKSEADVDQPFDSYYISRLRNSHRRNGKERSNRDDERDEKKRNALSAMMRTQMKDTYNSFLQEDTYNEYIYI
jgi:hypothetical protein